MGDDIRQHERRDEHAGGDAHRARDRLGPPFGRQGETAGRLGHRPAGFEQGLARLAEVKAAGAALKQAHAECGLEAADVAADGRLAQPQGAAGA